MNDKIEPTPLGVTVILDAPIPPDEADAKPKRPGRPKGWRAPLFSDLTGLTVEDFAFVRSVVSGMEASKAYARFFGHREFNEDGTPIVRHGHTINSLANKLRSDILAVAENSADENVRHAFKELSLVMPSLDPDEAASDAPAPSPAPSAKPGQTPPTFDQWFADQDPDYYRENELVPAYREFLEAWHAEHPAAAQPGPSPTLDYEEWEADQRVQALSMGERIERYKKYLSGQGLSEREYRRKLVPVQRGYVTDRHVHALNLLQNRLAMRPARSHDTRQWLSVPMADVLSRIGVRTIAQLFDLINRKGPTWSNKVPGLGRVRADKLVIWMDFHAESLGAFDRSAPQWQKRGRMPVVDNKLERAPSPALLLSASDGVLQVDASWSAAASGILPLQTLQIPPELDGRNGMFRVDAPNHLGASNDYQAVLSWLQTFETAGKHRTLDAYQREVERFYLWCIREARISLSSVTLSHALAYQQFLKAIPDEYICDDRVTRSDPRWRPWRGQLSQGSQDYAFVVLRRLYKTLSESNYLAGNPFVSVRSSATQKPILDTTRSLNREDLQWVGGLAAALLREVEDEEATLPLGADGRPVFSLEVARKRRLVLILHLLLTTGLRLSEVVTSKFKTLTPALVDGVPQPDDWILPVVGKGNKLRSAPIRGQVYRMIVRHHQDVDQTLAEVKTTKRDVSKLRDDPPLVCALRSSVDSKTAMIDDDALMGHDNLALTAGGVYKVLTRFFRAKASTELKATLKASRKVHGELARARKFNDSLHIKQLESEQLRLNIAADRWRRLAKVSTHWMRHTFAMEVLRQNKDDAGLILAQQLLGHASISTTAVYLKQDESAKVLAARKVNPLGL